jgi:hypothetical protein
VLSSGPRPAVRGLVLTTASATVLALAACGGSEDTPAAAPTSAAATTPAPTTPAAEPTRAPASLLSGREGVKDGPVLVVKIDNTSSARPQAGLDAADVVYIEQVEGGLTRIAAVYSSRLPSQVGPVRSARITDLELMRQFGRVAFAYSGANRRFLPQIQQAPLEDVSVDRVPSAYQRSSSRRAPYNLFADPGKVLAAAKGATAAKDVGFRFGPPLPGGRKAKQVSVSYPAARVGFTWDGKGWQWSMDRQAGRTPSGSRLSAATVVVQYVKVTGSPFADVNGAQTPYSRTVGAGKALFLRDGQSWQGAWSRKGPTTGTSYTVGGKPATFASGPVWVVLAPAGRTASVS